MKAAVDDAIARFGGLDIMVANAGTEGVLKPVDVLSVAEFEDTLLTNVTGVWLSMKHAVAPMRAQGAGSIIALSSIAGVIGFPAMAPYIASKHVVYGLVKTAVLELGEANIRVNAVGPGPIDNRMIASLQSSWRPTIRPRFAARSRRASRCAATAPARKVAHLIAFLASDAASYCNGAIYMIDGGFTAA